MFEAPESLPTPRCSLLAVSSKFGLTFVGCPTGKLHDWLYSCSMISNMCYEKGYQLVDSILKVIHQVHIHGSCQQILFFHFFGNSSGQRKQTYSYPCTFAY